MSHPNHPQPFVKYSTQSLGYSISVNGPATAEDFDRLVGKPNAAVAEAMQQWFYRVGNPKFRELFSARLESETGVPRESEDRIIKRGEGAGSTQKVYTETEQKYINRLESGTQLPDGSAYTLDAGDAMRWAMECAAELGDWSPVDGVSDRKPAAKFYETAREYLAKVAAGRYSVEHLVSVLEDKSGVPFQSTWGEVNEDNVARCLKFIEQKQEQERKNLL